MINELSNKFIYNDFVDKTFLTDEEKVVLDMFINKETIVKISQQINMSERNASRVLKNVKIKYENYKKLQIAMLNLFLS